MRRARAPSATDKNNKTNIVGTHGAPAGITTTTRVASPARRTTRSKQKTITIIMFSLASPHAAGVHETRTPQQACDKQRDHADDDDNDTTQRISSRRQQNQQQKRGTHRCRSNTNTAARGSDDNTHTAAAAMPTPSQALSNAIRTRLFTAKKLHAVAVSLRCVQKVCWVEEAVAGREQTHRGCDDDTGVRLGLPLLGYHQHLVANHLQAVLRQLLTSQRHAHQFM